LDTVALLRNVKVSRRVWTLALVLCTAGAAGADWGTPRPAVYRVPAVDSGQGPLAVRRDGLADTLATAAATGQLTRLVVAAQVAGLAATLAGDAPFTLLAPTDAAFARLPAATVQSLFDSPESIADLVRFHLLPGRLDSRQLRSVDRLWTASGDIVRVDDIRMLRPDVVTSNGLIHVIDRVLLPGTQATPSGSRGGAETGDRHELVREASRPSA
jgi:uncharacterized surface protein with fasciclin (FAS1) repeats